MPANTYFIDNSERNVEIANEIGFKGIHYKIEKLQALGFNGDDLWRRVHSVWQLADRLMHEHGKELDNL